MQQRKGNKRMTLNQPAGIPDIPDQKISPLPSEKFPGLNTVFLNHAAMVNAIQQFFDRALIGRAPTVTSVTQINGEFRIVLKG
jgi:hypothetical protein